MVKGGGGGYSRNNQGLKRGESLRVLKVILAYWGSEDPQKSEGGYMWGFDDRESKGETGEGDVLEDAGRRRI